MPTYEYQCQDCGDIKTAILPMSERKTVEQDECSTCGNKSYKQVLTTVNFVYNRSGSMKISDNFNDRLKQIKKNVGIDGKSSIDNILK